MFDGRLRQRVSALLIQLLAIVGGVGIMAAAPPSSGRMMLVPIAANSARGMIGMAVEGGAALVGPGPLPGSFVIEGERNALMRTLLIHGVALIAAPVAGCGR